MRRVKILLVIFFIVPVPAMAQHGDGYWSIGTNPFSVAEPALTIGPCGSYTFSDRFELWGELSAIVKNNYFPGRWKNMRGYRFILQPRYTIWRRANVFVTPEFRLKAYSFNTTGDFINAQTNDTLTDHKFKEVQVLTGGALVFGSRIMLSAKRPLFVEFTAGIGGKYRVIKRKNIPSGYEYKRLRAPDSLSPHYEWDGQGVPYFPLGLRLVWRFDQ